jgi:hypothetical protein
VTKAHVHYSSNNSGGSWWLTDDDWFALEKAGWEVEWIKDDPYHKAHGDGERFLGALATGAKYFGGSVEMAMAEFNHVTSAWSYDTGCSCCGQPHYFTEYNDEGKMIW